jgi:PTS system nitrogen regulatory IIA component
MKPGVRDAARLLSVSEKNIYRWIREGAVPAYQINDPYRFNRTELLEWAAPRKISVSPESFAEPEGREGGPAALSEALRDGGVHYGVGGSGKSAVLRAIVDAMKLAEASVPGNSPGQVSNPDIPRSGD